MDEKTLLVRLRNGDETGYETLVRSYGGRMLAVALRFVRNEEDARECVQEAFLNAFKSLHRFEERSSLWTWLHQIVVRSALLKLRSRRRRPEESLDELMPQFDAYGCRVEPAHHSNEPVDRLLEQREIRETVHRAIDQLPETYRNVLLLRDIEELDTEETAEMLDTTPGAVKTRLHRARAALKKLIEPVLEKETP